MALLFLLSGNIDVSASCVQSVVNQGLTNQIFIFLSGKKGLTEKAKIRRFSLYNLYIFLGK